MTASVARLAFAIATISLKLNIWGSRRNCVAPPDSEMAVATSVASSALMAAAATARAERAAGRRGGAGRAESREPLAWSRHRHRRGDRVEDDEADDGGEAELGE